MFASPTSGIVSTLIRSPRRLWRSASLHGAERDLGDLRAAADDDHPLAEDRAEGPRPADRLDVRQPVEARRRARPRSARRPRSRSRPGRRIASRASGRSRRSGPGRRARASAGDDRGDRLRPVEDVEAGGGGVDGDAGRARHRRRARRTASAGDDVGDRHPARVGRRRRHRGPRRRCRRRRTAARVASASLVSSISSPSVSSAIPTMPAMFTPRSASAVAMRASAPGPIVELDREPDRHAATSCVGRWYPPRRRAAATIRPCPPADPDCPERPDLRPRSRPRRRARRSASSRSGGSRSTRST